LAASASHAAEGLGRYLAARGIRLGEHGTV
jgi:hypothetical protein